MAPVPQIARTPLTTKQPESCPHCGGHSLSRRGTRRKKLEIVQLWRCGACKRTFTPAPEAMRNKTYPLRIILSAISDYDVGYTLDETAARLKAKANRSVSPSTIASWLRDYAPHCSYRRLRSKARTRFPAAQAVRSIKLYHRQVYSYAYHRPKIELLRGGLLDDKRRGDTRFTALADFLERLPSECPHELFTRQDDLRARASQARPAFADTSRLTVSVKQNAATQAAALIIPSVGNNKLRHESLQRFMLANDSTTVAVEVPVWLGTRDLAVIQRQYGIELAPGDVQAVVTGHIDFLQVRNGSIYVLDYKPDTRTNKPIAQLAIYALALSRLTGIKLFDIKCAWFNEHEYCEFFPRALLAQRPRTGRGEMARNSSGPKPAARATAKNTVLDAGNLTRKPNPRRNFRQVSAALPS